MEAILLIHEDFDIADMIRRYLMEKGERVVVAINLNLGMDLLLREDISTVIMDLGSKSVHELDLYRRIKKISAIPIIFLIQEVDVEMFKKSIMCNADDYIIKPFSMMDLHLRIQAKKHDRYGYPLSKHLLFPPLQIDLETRIVQIEQTHVTLTSSEYDILLLLANKPQMVFTMSEIYQSVWKMPDMNNAHTVQVHIANLRKKLDQAYPGHRYVQTVWGKGYKFQP